jgi:transglutaminase-like putative cysteine protease
MRLRSAVLVMCISVCGPALAQNNEVQRGPVPAWVAQSELLPVPADASGLVFVRRQDFLIHLDGQGQAQYVGYRIKILHPNALQLGNLSIAWNPASGAPVVHVLRIYRDNEVIDVLQKASFEILRREDQLEASRLDGTLTAVLRVADLRVGDEIELGLTTRSNDPTLGDKSSGMLVLAPSPSAGRYVLGLSWEKDQKPRIKMSPDMAAVARQSDRAVEFRFDNPASKMPPSDAPARFQLPRNVEYSDFADWAAVSRHFAPLFTKAATLAAGSPLKHEAERIAATNPRPLDRASAALKLVQQDVRYIYVGLNGGNLTPATAEETWQRRYGDCKGKTALLLALLRELGIDAEPVLANNGGGDDGLDERLPNPGMFDHVLVRARIDGVQYWLDGTMPPVVPPRSRPVLPYKWVLPLTEKGSAIEHLEWRPAKTPDQITLIEMDARGGFEQQARVKNTTIIRGIPGLQQQVQFSGLTHDQLLNAFRQQLVGNTWRMIDDVQWRYDPKAEASILTINGSWVIDWDDDGHGLKSVALPGGGFSPPDRRGRPADQNQDLPYYNKPSYDCSVTTVRLPATTKPTQWSFKTSYNTRIFGRNYYRAFEIRDGSIRMIRGSRIELQEIDAATARKDDERITKFDNSMGWIFYDPRGNALPDNGDKNIPATYDVDWATDDRACLAPTTVR